MQNKLDFSSLEQLTPRADSWEKVCARLDADSSKVDALPSNLIPFRITSAIPLAASLVLIGISVLMTAFSNTSENISISTITSTEVSSWYHGLGSDNDNDDFDTLDENVTLSYFYKDAK